MADLVLRPSIKGVLFLYVLSTILLIAALVLTPSSNWGSPAFLAFLALPVAIDVWATMKFVGLTTSSLTLSDGVLRFQQGVVSKSQRNIILNKVRDVRVEQTAGQRLINVGNLSIEAIGDSGNVTLENVDRPRHAADAILSAVRTAKV